MLLLLLAGLGLYSVIRLRTPEGTLVVEADDPDVRVTIDNNGMAIIATGTREIHLRPGHYKIQASKDGKPVLVSQELITISRGSRTVVRVGPACLRTLVSASCTMR